MVPHSRRRGRTRRRCDRRTRVRGTVGRAEGTHAIRRCEGVKRPYPRAQRWPSLRSRRGLRETGPPCRASAAPSSVSFPAWTVHEVEPVTAGERWALIANGWGRRCASRARRNALMVLGGVDPGAAGGRRRWGDVGGVPPAADSTGGFYLPPGTPSTSFHRAVMLRSCSPQ